MQGIAQLILGIVGIIGYFWVLGFWWGIGLGILFLLISMANKD